MSGKDPKIMSFDEFVAHLGHTLSLQMTSVTPETTLGEDMALDSLQMLELVLLMEDLGAEIYEDMIGAVRSVGDLYYHYHVRNSHP